MADNNDNREARFTTALGLGVRWKDGKPVKNYHPWELEADRLLEEVSRTHSDEAVSAYFAFLRTRPAELK